MSEQPTNSTSMSSAVYNPKGLQFLKEAVHEADCLWCGVQETIEPQVALLLFNSPTTGSTLAVKFNPTHFSFKDLVTAIKARREESDETFKERRISLKLSVLRGWMNKAILLGADEIATEINAVLNRRKQCPKKPEKN